MKKHNLWFRSISLLLTVALWSTVLPAVPARALETEEIEAEAPMVEYQDRTGNFTQATLTGADNQRAVQMLRAQLGRDGSSLGYSEEWCGNFVCDVSRAIGVGQSVVPWNYTGRAYVPYLYTHMVERMGLRTVTPQEALPGDIIMFCWNPPEGREVRANDLDHVAMVVWHDEDAGLINYIGGNQGNGGNLYKRNVSEIIMDASSDEIAFIIRPNYASSDPGEPLRMMRVTTTTVGDGTVERQGTFVKGQQSTVKAVPGNSEFVGWYDKNGTLLTTDRSYTFTVTEHTALQARFRNYYTVGVTCSRSGTVTGAGTILQGSTATLQAVPAEGKTFAGWYDEKMELLSTEPTLTWTVDGNRKLYAIFDKDRFIDVPVGVWYRDDVTEAADRGIVKGVTALEFVGDAPYTRAMAAEMLARLSGADTSTAPASAFRDVPGNAWFAGSINWAAQQGIVKGKSATEFAPDEKITRQDFIVMAVRYLESYQKLSLESAAIRYPDAAELNADYALEPAKKAQAIGLIKGDEGTGKLRPKDTLSRAEGTTVLMRLVRYLEARETPEEPPEENSEQPAA